MCRNSGTWPIFQKFRRGLEHREFAVQLVMWGRGTSIKFSTGRLGEQIPSVCIGTSYQSDDQQKTSMYAAVYLGNFLHLLQYLNLGTVGATCTGRESFSTCHYYW
jgi:hypothetical protein